MQKHHLSKRLLSILILLIIFFIGLLLGSYIRSQTFNPRARIPGPLEKIFSFGIEKGIEGDEDLLYSDTNLYQFTSDGSSKTKVAVSGIVDKIYHEPDGDYHVIVRPVNNSSVFLVTEFIPEIKLDVPKVGDKIKIWGITRFDILHDWWELHPVIGWERL